jgi:hypothetical protein
MGVTPFLGGRRPGPGAAPTPAFVPHRPTMGPGRPTWGVGAGARAAESPVAGGRRRCNCGQNACGRGQRKKAERAHAGPPGRTRSAPPAPTLPLDGSLNGHASPNTGGRGRGGRAGPATAGGARARSATGARCVKNSWPRRASLTRLLSPRLPLLPTRQPPLSLPTPTPPLPPCVSPCSPSWSSSCWPSPWPRPG